MEYQNSIRFYTRSVMDLGIKQHLPVRDVLGLSGGMALWRRVGSLFLLVILSLLLVHLFMASMLRDVEQSISMAEIRHHELMDGKIELLAQRAAILSPEHVRQEAAEKLSLYKPAKGQVIFFDRRTGTFSYL